MGSFLYTLYRRAVQRPSLLLAFLHAWLYVRLIHTVNVP
jgi:hypothetical protein